MKKNRKLFDSNCIYQKCIFYDSFVWFPNYIEACFDNFGTTTSTRV